MNRIYAVFAILTLAVVTLPSQLKAQPSGEPVMIYVNVDQSGAVRIEPRTAVVDLGGRVVLVFSDTFAVRLPQISSVNYELTGTPSVIIGGGGDVPNHVRSVIIEESVDPELGQVGVVASGGPGMIIKD